MIESFLAESGAPKCANVKLPGDLGLADTLAAACHGQMASRIRVSLTIAVSVLPHSVALKRRVAA